MYCITYFTYFILIRSGILFNLGKIDTMKNWLLPLVILLFIGCEIEEQEPTFTLTTNSFPPEGGKIIVSPNLKSYNLGDEVILLPEPSENWVFKQWSENEASSQIPLKITMDSNKSIVGTFVKKEYPLKITIKGEGIVNERIISNSNGKEYPHETTVELTPVPKSGWLFDSWSGDVDSKDSILRLKVTKEISIVANFDKVKSIKILERPDEVIISKSFDLKAEIEFVSGKKIINPLGMDLFSKFKLLTIKDQKIIGAKSGIDFLFVKYGDVKDSLKISINPIEEVSIVDNFLSNPIAGHSLKIPVVIINYIPTNDGLTKDDSRAPDYFKIVPRKLEDVKISLEKLIKGIKFSAEEGSRFRDYASKSKDPYIGIEIVKQFNFYEIPLMPFKALSPSDYELRPMHEPDYFKIFEKIDLKNLVNNFGVKEVWFNTSHFYKELPSYDSKIHESKNFLVMAESNMSSPLTGDISNSYRKADDLPIYNNSYVVYGFNYNGAFDIIDFIPNNIHVRSHQIEIQLNERDNSPNKELWRNMFIGIPLNGGKPSGRVGNVHFPPNASNDYDYHNSNLVLSDIEDWKPDGSGSFKGVNNDTWKKLSYTWPIGVFSDSQSNWLLYWYQSIPGNNNNLTYKGRPLTNWWDIYYKWDYVVKNNIRLYHSN